MNSGREISRLISQWLRHKPADGGIVVDELGWTPVADVLLALKRRGVVLSEGELLVLSRSFDKVRWEFDELNTRMRATHGHSIPVIIEKVATPPDVLYHGTSLKSLEAIINGGLSAMKRQYVHLSSKRETALSVGQRHGAPIVLEVDAAWVRDDGYTFHQTSDNVWLIKEVPAKYLLFGPWRSTSPDEQALVDELKREVGRDHLLFEKTENLKVIMRRDDRDDCLFIDKQSREVYEVHLTWSKGTETDAQWPSAQYYETLNTWLSTGFLEDYHNF